MIRVSRLAMGTEFQAILAGADPDYLRDAATQALDEVERLEEQISHYNPTSDLYQINLRASGEPVLVEPTLLGLLARALELARATGGAFDPTSGALVKAWGFYRGRGQMPEELELAGALTRTGAALVRIDAAAGTVRFTREGVELHLGAFGKGAAVDRVVAVLRQLRVQSALVHGGTSTIYALGDAPGGSGWLVGLSHPRDRGRRLGVVRLKDRALSTSGDYEQFFEHEGQRYSHILDPRTGRPAEGILSATVLADSAETSDALSTAAFVLGEVGAAEMCDRFPGAGAIMAPAPTGGGEQDTELTAVCLGEAELLPDSAGEAAVR